MTDNDSEKGRQKEMANGEKDSQKLLHKIEHRK